MIYEYIQYKLLYFNSQFKVYILKNGRFYCLVANEIRISTARKKRTVNKLIEQDVKLSLIDVNSEMYSVSAIFNNTSA